MDKSETKFITIKKIQILEGICIKINNQGREIPQLFSFLNSYEHTYSFNELFIKPVVKKKQNFTWSVFLPCAFWSAVVSSWCEEN